MFCTMSLVLTLHNQFYFNVSFSMEASWDIFSYPYDDKQPFGSCAKKIVKWKTVVKSWAKMNSSIYLLRSRCMAKENINDKILRSGKMKSLIASLQLCDK